MTLSALTASRPATRKASAPKAQARSSSLKNGTPTSRSRLHKDGFALRCRDTSKAPRHVVHATGHIPSPVGVRDAELVRSLLNGARGEPRTEGHLERVARHCWSWLAGVAHHLPARQIRPR